MNLKVWRGRGFPKVYFCDSREWGVWTSLHSINWVDGWRKGEYRIPTEWCDREVFCVPEWEEV